MSPQTLQDPLKKRQCGKIGTDTCGCFQESDRSLWAFEKFCSSISCFTFYERKSLKDEESFLSYPRKCFSAGLVWLTLSCLHESLLHRNRFFGGDAKGRTNQSRIIISDPAITTGANEQTRCKYGDWASYVEICEMDRLLATAVTALWKNTTLSWSSYWTMLKKKKKTLKICDWWKV